MTTAMPTRGKLEVEWIDEDSDEERKRLSVSLYCCSFPVCAGSISSKSRHSRLRSAFAVSQWNRNFFSKFVATFRSESMSGVNRNVKKKKKNEIVPTSNDRRFLSTAHTKKTKVSHSTAANASKKKWCVGRCRSIDFDVALRIDLTILVGRRLFALHSMGERVRMRRRRLHFCSL
jgi:hypothetical protein